MCIENNKIVILPPAPALPRGTLRTGADACLNEAKTASLLFRRWRQQRVQPRPAPPTTVRPSIYRASLTSLSLRRGMSLSPSPPPPPTAHSRLLFLSSSLSFLSPFFRLAPHDFLRYLPHSSYFFTFSSDLSVPHIQCIASSLHVQIPYSIYSALPLYCFRL